MKIASSPGMTTSVELVLKSSSGCLQISSSPEPVFLMTSAQCFYITFLYTGAEADSLMDGEAKEIFLTNADRHYTDSSLSDEAYFAKIFRDSADDLMGK